MRAARRLEERDESVNTLSQPTPQVTALTLRHLRSYLQRKAEQQQEIIDNVGFFTKCYDAAVDELEELEELIELVTP